MSAIIFVRIYFFKRFTPSLVFHVLFFDIIILSDFFPFPTQHTVTSAARQENYIECSNKSVCHNKQGLSGVRTGRWTAAYQQAPAVPKPPAAVLPSQHEGEGLAEAKNKYMHMRSNAKTQSWTQQQILVIKQSTIVLGLAWLYIQTVQQVECTDKRVEVCERLPSLVYCYWLNKVQYHLLSVIMSAVDLGLVKIHLLQNGAKWKNF